MGSASLTFSVPFVCIAACVRVCVSSSFLVVVSFLCGALAKTPASLIEVRRGGEEGGGDSEMPNDKKHQDNREVGDRSKKMKEPDRA